jgi:hypothetical protein
MRDYTAEDKAMRERLERQSPGGRRVDMVDRLNRMAAGDAAQGLPGITAYALIMAAQQAHGRHVRKLNKTHDRAIAAGKLDGGEGERLDRIHPASVAAAELRRRYFDE